ncbi:hypothetical protein L6R52_16595 [Myxococcota bacterium]|nr:hypothetical protein [Myxococcota bacterium]
MSPLSKYRMRPGAGFVLLVVVITCSAVFFAWGARRPALDEVWQLGLELRLGRSGPLDDRELALFQRELCRHPGLADDLLEGRKIALISAHRRGLVDVGWAYLVRAADQPKLGVAVSMPAGSGDVGDDGDGRKKKPRTVELRARTTAGRHDATVAPGAEVTWLPPGPEGCATLVELVTERGTKKKRAEAPFVVTTRELR